MQQEDLETGTVNLRADAHKMVFPAFESRYSRLRRTVVALKKHVSNEEQCNFVGRATHRWAFLPPYGEQNERWDFEEWMDGRKKTRNRISDNAWPTELTLLNSWKTGCPDGGHTISSPFLTDSFLFYLID